MTFEYLGRKYSVDAAWKLIEEGHAELVELSDAQVQAIKNLPKPLLENLDLTEETDDPIVLVRDAIPSSEGPPEIVAILIDGWGRFIKKLVQLPHEKIQAWLIADTDLVEELIVDT